jgi:hypothetical protein
MAGTDDGPEEFRPPTKLESAVRDLGADAADQPGGPPG